MPFPEFFTRVPSLTLRDPLARFLGSAADGLIEYGYVDAVRLTGHSCPTVASAYLMTCRALRYLYGDAIPERGNIRVQFRDGEEDGVTGVQAAVVGLLTGAAGRGGFRGLAGHFSRRQRLCFGVGSISGVARFSRLDTEQAVDAAIDLSALPSAPGLTRLLERALTGQSREEFAAAWQERVRCLLMEHRDDAQWLRLHPVDLPRAGADSDGTN